MVLRAEEACIQKDKMALRSPTFRKTGPRKARLLKTGIGNKHECSFYS